EDGIRDLTVTGVQTCALPISRNGRCLMPSRTEVPPDEPPTTAPSTAARHSPAVPRRGQPRAGHRQAPRLEPLEERRLLAIPFSEIGRASCRERVQSAVLRGPS